MSNYQAFCERYGLDPYSDKARNDYVEAQRNLRALHSAAAKAGAAQAIHGACETNESTLTGDRQWLRSQIMSLATELHDRSGKSAADHQTEALLRQAAGLQDDQIMKETLNG